MKFQVLAGIGALALTASPAFAGDGCIYGDKIAADTDTISPIMAIVDEAEAERLAKLKQEQATLEQLIETPVIHN